MRIPKVALSIPLSIAAVLLLGISRGASAQPLAFPGAEGFACHASGGRGGDIYTVTNLEDSGPGSLRDGVSKGPRTIIFQVGGYIPLKSVLQVASDITIAGQTAPGEGIATRNCEVSFSHSRNIIIRYIRFRQGVTPGQEKKSAVNITDGQDIIFDHVSIEWGRWDTVDMNLCNNITLQNCIIGQGVAPQRFGCLCQSDNVTWTHNLFINNHSRNPKAKGKVQYVNNVVYNWGVVGYVGGHSAADHVVDIVGNYFIAGPDSSAHFVGEFKPTDHVYQTANYVDLSKAGQLAGRLVVAGDFGKGADAPTLMPSETITDKVPLTIDTAQAAYEKVVASAGDSLHRDAVDERLIADLKSLGKAGKIISDPREVGGFGEISSVSSKNVPPPPAASEAQKVGAEGYTMLEQYLNDLVKPKP